MTNDRHVKAETLRMVRKTLEPGRAVTAKIWRMNYDLVRAQAIADTIIWKQNNVTIEGEMTMDIYAPKYSSEARHYALKLVHLLRPRVVLPNDTLKGTRFNSDDHTLWELESAAVESKFIEDPAFHVSRALVGSAKSDYWYDSSECAYKWEDDYDDGADCEVEE